MNSRSEATRAYLEQHGKPVTFYSDKASIRAVRDSTDFGRGTTQFGRVLFELNIDIMCANTSQAKGRVERANLTLQDRLVKELRCVGSTRAKRPMRSHRVRCASTRARR